MKSIQDSAMLVTLTIHQWTNRKHDKSVSTEVEKTHDAKDAGRYNKQLINKAALEPISKLANGARDYHYKMTLPWGNNGERLLPSALFSDYVSEINSYKAKNALAVRAFVEAYPTLVLDARKRLGTMYNALDYPPSNEIASRFGMDTAFMPIPSANDFRVKLSEDQVENIRDEINGTVLERQREAMKDCWARVRDVVSKIHERLVDQDAKFRDTLITNAEDLLKVLPALNIMGDPELDSIASEVRDLLVHPDRLRQDKQLRNETADKAAAIFERMKGYY